MIYSLRSENLTHLGGLMGTEFTFENWTKYFNTIEEAKKFAEKDYGNGRNRERIIWSDTKEWKKKISPWHQDVKKDVVRSQDLGFVMYYIKPIEIES